MGALIDNMVREFEHGRLSRRELVERVFLLVACAAGVTRSSAGQEPASTFHATGLNHIALRVEHIPRARDFYQRHLGLKVIRETPGSCFLSCGESFVTLFRGSEPGLDHYCYAIEDFSPREAAERLRSVGIEPRIRGARIYFDDPDGLEVQLAAPEHMP